jgi:hypothetical protein
MGKMKAESVGDLSKYRCAPPAAMVEEFIARTVFRATK